MHNGFIKIYRKLSDNPLWMKKPFSDGQAWVDLLMVANHKKGVIDKRGHRVVIERGQVGYSVKGLADRWGWSRGKVERFLKYLENEHQIEQQKSNVTTLITLTNYETYNETNTKTDTGRAADEQQTSTNKNEKNDKKKPLPKNFNISPRVEEWAVKDNHSPTQDDLEAFKLHHEKNGSKFANWDSAFMTWMRNKKKFSNDQGSPDEPRGKRLKK